MKQGNELRGDMLDPGEPGGEGAVVWAAGKPVGVRARGVGRLPALPAALGRGRGRHVGRHGGLAARGSAFRVERVRLLEPRHPGLPRGAVVHDILAVGQAVRALDAVWRVHLAHALPWHDAARTVCVSGRGGHRAQLAEVAVSMSWLCLMNFLRKKLNTSELAITANAWADRDSITGVSRELLASKTHGS